MPIINKNSLRSLLDYFRCASLATKEKRLFLFSLDSHLYLIPHDVRLTPSDNAANHGPRLSDAIKPKEMHFLTPEISA